VSVPLTALDYRKIELYSTATSSAFAYDGGYQSKDTLTNGPGYWLKFDAPQWVALFGTARTFDTLIVKDKWNMIGSIASTVPIGNIVQIPESIVTSSYFSYDEGYFIATSIEPGKAYWVKTSGGGLLALGSSSAHVASSKQSAQKEDARSPNVITIEPQSTIAKAKARKQQLLFGRSNVLSQDMGVYDLPPVPPSGSADVRFASNRFAELIPDALNEPKEFPLKIQSNGSPLKLSWTINEEKNIQYFFVEKTGKKVTAKHSLRGNKSVIINPTEEKRYALLVEQIPTEFSLLQNYPNPFNPSTVIRYQLSVNSVVTLKVFNLLGQEIEELVDEVQDAGVQSVEWNASEIASGTSSTSGYASGVYFYQLTATEIGTGKVFRDVKKLMLVR
ncbi:MAG: T9SS type A sorting domain-containing protein, partial [Ignavibacteriae bacterium]|nr:T9SS type A sorting domain-containing protein [Ignavibacteriota bacterium]